MAAPFNSQPTTCINPRVLRFFPHPLKVDPSYPPNRSVRRFPGLSADLVTPALTKALACSSLHRSCPVCDPVSKATTLSLLEPLFKAHPPFSHRRQGSGTFIPPRTVGEIASPRELCLGTVCAPDSPMQLSNQQTLMPFDSFAGCFFDHNPSFCSFLSPSAFRVCHSLCARLDSPFLDPFLPGQSAYEVGLFLVFRTPHVPGLPH